MAETTVKMDDFGMFFAVLALHSLASALVV